jgi:signal transduction histidine kinase
MSIRFKVILPYLLLTVIVAVIGVYVVTRLVSNTLEERLTNQLLEAGRVVSDTVARQEIRHVTAARLIAYTEGLADALAEDNGKIALMLAEPAFTGLGYENLILVSPQGKELVHLLADENGDLQQEERNTGIANSSIVSPFLQNKDPEAPPLRALGENMVNGKTYYYTALPVTLNGEFNGVVVIGTSTETLLQLLKATSLSDVILYGENGRLIGSTLRGGIEDTLEPLTMTKEEYQKHLSAEDLVRGNNNIIVLGRSYSIAHGPLQVGNVRIGVFAVALPSEFVTDRTLLNRLSLIVLFATAFIVVVIIGIIVARRITNPIFSLVATSQAIAGGNLEERTGIQSNDEIGVLATNFDEMTTRLEEQTLRLEEKNSQLEEQKLLLEKQARELKQMNQFLENVNKTKTNFIQISAHELRTPLTIIMGYSQMLEQDTKDDQGLYELAHGILEGSERMNDIVDSMLDVSRIDSNTLLLKKTELQLGLVMEKTVKGFRKALEERNIQVTIENLDELPLVPADPDLLQKVFHHLVMNAIKFTPDGGSIFISGKYMNGSEPPLVQIAVRDTGIGIDPSLHQLIFEKFNKTGDVLLHSSGKTKFKGGGPGLGLAIARGIVEAHKGRIWVESLEYNESTNPGSTFFVSLPVRKQIESKT